METAPQVICQLQRQQTRLLVDYLQALLNKINQSSVILTGPQLAILDFTCNTLSSISQPAAESQAATDNQVALSSFSLQLMLEQTLTKPLKQTQEFHRQPDFNFAQSKRSTHQNQDSLTAATAVVQHAMQWLNTAGVTMTSHLDQMLHHLQHPNGVSKLPGPDDAEYLEPSNVQVRSNTSLCMISLCCVSACFIV